MPQAFITKCEPVEEPRVHTINLFEEAPMIGILYAQRWNGGWAVDKLGSLPLETYAWRCNESFMLLPHVAQVMCWGETP